MTCGFGAAGRLSRVTAAIFAENLREMTKTYNENRELLVGDKVIDIDKNLGIVVKIIIGTDIDDHGTIYVWQLERVEYGSDNCEHYAEINWRENLRIL